MDQKTRLMVNTSAQVISLLLRNPSTWDFSGSAPVPRSVELDGKVWQGDELNDFAQSAKRKGDYAASIQAYTYLIKEEYSQYGKLYILIFRGFWKTLVSANAFELAYIVISTMLADMQQALLKGSAYVDKTEFTLVEGYFQEMYRLAIQVVDNNDFSGVFPFASKYSGSPLYRLPSDQVEIRKEFQGVRTRIRMVYGK